MDRPSLLQSIGLAVLLAASAVTGGRKIASDSGASERSAFVVAGAPATPMVSPHLDGAALLKAFYQDDAAPGTRRGLRVLILTLPDPISSHLDWSYDAQLESVRRAMEHSGYVIDRFWLPWRATSDTTAARQGIADSLPAAHWPGVMLFRHGDTRDESICLVYVVGEVPTSGVHPMAMMEALNERRRLLPVDFMARGVDTVRVVGPAFSGSSLSLRRALAKWRVTVTDEPIIEIVSGSASDARNLQTLTDTTMRMSFRATVHTSGWLAAAALKVVTEQLDIRPADVAFLHEGTTQFGNSAGGDSVAAKLDSTTRSDSTAANASPPEVAASSGRIMRALTFAAGNIKRGAAHAADFLERLAAPHRARSTSPPTTAKVIDTIAMRKADASKLPLEIAFPMSISGLRVQYARHPNPLPAEATNGAPPPAAPRLALDQREPASLSESPAVLSQLTAPSTELLLAQIERSLLAHHVRAVGILATDVRDELFLADEIRKQLPDVQLFFYGSNVLRLRSDFQKAVRGSLVVSTYPLVTENQFWDLTNSDRERLAFMGDESEGVFNAMLYQLGKRAAMMDYARPLSSVTSHGPPTWLTVVGRDAMYPVALIDSLAPTVTDAENKYVALRSANPVRDTSEWNERAGRFEVVLVLMLIGFITSFVMLQRRTSRRVKAVTAFPSHTLGRPGADASDQREDRQRALRWASLLLHREMYVLLRHFSLFAAYSCALLLLFRPQAHGIAWTPWVLWLVGIAGTFLTTVVFWRAVVQSRDVLWIGRKHNVRLFYNGVYPRRRDRLLSRVELGARIAIFVLGLMYFFLTLFFLSEVMSLNPVSSALFFQRAVAVTGGVSPAVPLVLAAIGFAAWCTWHLLRISLLAEPTVFEEFLLRQADNESTRRVAMRFIRAIQMDVESEAREALKWSSLAINSSSRERRSKLPKRDLKIPKGAAVRRARDAENLQDEKGDDLGSRWFRGAPMSPSEMLQRAEDCARRASELSRRADSETKRAREETPNYVFGMDRTPEQVIQEIQRAAKQAESRVAYAHDFLKARPEEKHSDERGGATSRTGLVTRVRALGRSFAAAATRAGRVVSAGAHRLDEIGALRRFREAATRNINRFADWYERSRHDDHEVRRAPSAAKEVSDALFYLIPNGVALAVLIGGLGFALWLGFEFELSLEALVLPPRSWLFEATSFDVLFRFAILTLAGVTAWAIYRLTAVWSGISRVLEEIPPDLVPSFVALPPKLARVAHLTLFGHASVSEIQEVVDETAKRMEVAFGELPADFRANVERELGDSRLVPAPCPRARPYHLDATSHKEFARLHRALDLCRQSKLLEGLQETPATDPAEWEKQRLKVAWGQSIANLYVVFVADYVDWVFQHMRYLASFLLVCLLVMIVLLSSYPFQPQSALQVIHTCILVVAVATLVYVIVQMNRQPIVSAIANTTPGAVSWDSRFVGTLVTYALLPLMTLLSTQFPAVRDFLFSWVAPLIRSLGKG